MTADEQLIRDLQQRWMKAWQQQDAAALEHILADDFVFTLSTDPTKPFRRSEWMQMALGSYTCETFTYENMAVRLLDHYAVVCSHLRQRASIGDIDRSGRFLLTDIWRRDGDMWKVIARYSSYPEPTSPSTQALKG